MILLGKQYNNEVALLQNKQHNSPQLSGNTVNYPCVVSVSCSRGTA